MVVSHVVNGLGLAMGLVPVLILGLIVGFVILVSTAARSHYTGSSETVPVWWDDPVHGSAKGDIAGV